MMTRDQPTSAPSTIGDYEIVRYVGGGGYAETFLAFRTNETLPAFRRPYCIKRLLPPHAADSRFASEFVEEALLGCRFMHPNIVQAHDVGLDDQGVPFFAMDYVDGLDLSKLLAEAAPRRGLPIDLAVEVCYGIARALDYAHSLTIDGVPQNIIHRDIKPSNVLIDLFGRVLLIDFGIALHTAKGRWTQTGVAKGSPPYMSPEHLTLVRDDIETRSDLFCLGILFYECLTGVNPFLANTDQASALAVANCKPKPILQYTNLPVGLAELAEQLLQRDKEARPANARELVERLSQYRRVGADVELGRQVVRARQGQAALGLGGQTTRRAAAKADESSTRPKPPSSEVVNLSEPATAKKEPVLTPISAVRTEAEDSGPLHPRAARLQRKYTRIALVGAALVAALGAVLVTSQFGGATRQQALPSPNSAASAPRQNSTAATPAVHPGPSAATPPVAPAGPVAAIDSNRPPPTSPPVEDQAGRQKPENASDVGNKEQAATLRVHALEWGYIWIDGTYRGDTKVTVPGLAPGPHVIGLASEPGANPEQTHKVTLRSGMNFKKYNFVKASLSPKTQ